MPKKTISVKFTDANKPWNRRSKPSGFRIDTIPLNKTILIVCEGQTEKLYFESFPVLSVKIKVIDLKGQSKLRLIESTIDIVASKEVEFNEVWCVFDMDVKSGEKEFADFDNAINRALSLGYKVAYSNDAFELWFYLHYKYQEAQNHRTYYYDELSRLFGLKYVHEGKRYAFCREIYSLLNTSDNSSQSQAIERAKKLFIAKKDLPFSQQNPVTKVYELVEELNKNLRR